MSTQASVSQEEAAEPRSADRIAFEAWAERHLMPPYWEAAWVALCAFTTCGAIAAKQAAERERLAAARAELERRLAAQIAPTPRFGHLGGLE